MNKFIKIISDVLFFTGLIIAGLFLAGHFTGKQFFSAYIVSSGSMEPAIHTGSVAVVFPKNSYQPGDIITFYTGTDKKMTTTHRLIATDGQVFKVGGDANNQPDPALVPKDKIIGAVRFSVPYAGYLAASAKTPKGFILLVIVPATIIIYEELKSLFIEIKKGISRKSHAGMKQIASQPDAGSDQAARSAFANAEWPKFLKPAIILPIFFALLIPLTLSISYFIDRETSSGNTITAFTDTPPLPEARGLNMMGPVLDTIVGDATDSGSPPATDSAVIEPTPIETPTPSPSETPAPTEIPLPTEVPAPDLNI